MTQPPTTGGKNILLGPSLVPIPERLLLAHAQGRVLFVAGAGVSRSAGLPDFRCLVLRVYEELDKAVYSEIATNEESACNPVDLELSGLQASQKAEVVRFQGQEYDVVLGMLERRLEGKSSADSPIRQVIGEVLRSGPSKSGRSCSDGTEGIKHVLRSGNPKPAPIHRALMRLSDRGEAVTIITTNFDLLLEDAARNIRQSVQTYALGSIPRPSLRPEFNGVLHIHGALDRNPKRTADLIISDQDFGEFYLRRRVVPDLIYDAARLYHLVLVGYSANDPPMRYLLNAVAADRTRFPDLKERFIFHGMKEDDPVELEDWRAQGITPIPYRIQNSDHSQLERTLGRWAEILAIGANRNRVERELQRIAKTRRTEANDEQRDLFDHLIRRSDPRERVRLSRLLGGQKADLGWLDAIVSVTSKDQRDG